jgi:hypothetical protein
VARPARWLGGVRRWCVLAAAVASVAGCVGMPSNGPVAQFSASPQSPAPDGDIIGVVPAGPQPGENPSQIVQGFLTASASYPSYDVAQEYLVSSAAKQWNPGSAVTLFSQLNVPGWVQTNKGGRNGGPQVSVDVSGPVQASLTGSGQYLSAQGQDQSQGPWTFYLVKVGGQWRITDPPSYRMLPSPAFPLFYKAQDLYFFNLNPPQDQVLVPDSVFVPLGATVSQLLTNLVNALSEGPRTPWLVDATGTELPAGTKVQQPVTTDGSTAIVNLTGNVGQASPSQLQQFSAQLVWTLTGRATSPLNIQSVVLELNGVPWTPPPSPCTGDRFAGPPQTEDAYECYNPYPSSPTSFYYIDRGQTWARCGAESLGLANLIGPVMPVVGRTGSFTSQSCDPDAAVHEANSGLPSAQPPSLPAVSMASVSPDGKYLAIVTAGKGDLYIGSLSGSAASFPRTPRLTGGVTSLSWDRGDDLWVAQGGDIEMVTPTGKGAVTAGFGGQVSDLSIAPDGVRIAFIAQTAVSPYPQIYLAAIGGGTPNSSQLGPSGTHLVIRDATSVGSGIAHPASLAWYDADDLIVVSDASTGNTLLLAPVDGQSAQTLQVQPQDVTSITADGPANVLVAGLPGGNLVVSTGIEGPWVQLGTSGQNPAYPG